MWLRHLIGWRALRILISASAVIYLALAIDLREIPQVVERVNWLSLIAAMGFYVVAIGIRTLRWFLLLRRRRQIPFFLLLQLNFVGMFGAFFLPSSVGEDAIRIILLNRYFGSVADTISATFIERITSLMALGMVAAWGAFQLRHSIAESLDGFAFGATAFGALVLAVTAVLLATLVVWRLPREGQPRTYLVGIFRDAWRIFQVYLADPTLLIVTILISFTFPLVTILANKLVAMALGLPVSLSTISLVVPVIHFLVYLPISLGNGLGLREGLYMLLFQPFGVSNEQAVALALVTRFLFTIIILGGALPCLLFGPHSLPERRLVNMTLRGHRRGRRSDIDLVDDSIESA